METIIAELNANAPAVQVVAAIVALLVTGALVLITRAYARDTQAIAAATRKSVEISQAMQGELRRQHQLSQVPLFEVHVSHEQYDLCRVVVTNTSGVIALDVAVNIQHSLASHVAFKHPGDPLSPAEMRSVVPPKEAFAVVVQGAPVPTNYRIGSPARNSTEGMRVYDGLVKSDDFEAGISVTVSYGNIFGVRFSQSFAYELRDRIVERSPGDERREFTWLDVGQTTLDITPPKTPSEGGDTQPA